MVASLYGLWPFRSYATVGEERIDIAHVLPQANMNLAHHGFSLSDRLRGGPPVLIVWKVKEINANLAAMVEQSTSFDNRRAK